jgi:hypothetical protein
MRRAEMRTLKSYVARSAPLGIAMMLLLATVTVAPARGGGARGGGGGARGGGYRGGGGFQGGAAGGYRGAGGFQAGGQRSYSQMNMANANVSRTNVFAGGNSYNANRDVDINTNVDYGRYGAAGYYGGYHGAYPPYGGVAYHGTYGYPVAAGAAYGAAVGTAAAATSAAVMGSYVNAIPASTCGQVYAGGTMYYNCGGTYYLPAYQGTQVVYQVVPPPA